MLIVCPLLNHAFQTNNIPYPYTRTASISTNQMGLLRQQMWAAWISNVNNARFLTAEYCLSCLHLWKVGYRFIYHHLSVKEHAKKCICCLWWLNIITLLHTHTRIRQCFWLSKEKKTQQHTDKRRRVKKDDIIQTREQFQQPSAFSSLIYMNVEHHRSMHTNRFKTHHNTLHSLSSICFSVCCFFDWENGCLIQQHQLRASRWLNFS